MKNILPVFLALFMGILEARSQVTFMETLKDGQGGIEGLMYPEDIITDSTGRELFIAARNMITHLRKKTQSYEYEFVESFQYSSDLYRGFWNADGVSSTGNGKFIYLEGDNYLNTFSITSDGRLNYQESLNNTDELTIGYALSSHVSISKDDRNLFLATTNGFKSALHVFNINPFTGRLICKNSILGWDPGVYFLDLACSPSDQFVYTSCYGNNIEPKLFVFKRIIEKDSLELVQVLTKTDSIKEPFKILVSNDNKNLYTIESRTVKTFKIDAVDGTVSYVDRLYIPDYFDKIGYTMCAAITRDDQFIYTGGSYSLCVIKRDRATGNLSFIQGMQVGNPEEYGSSDLKSMNLASHDSILYVVDTYNNSINIYSRNQSSGEITYLKKITDKQGKIFGLASAMDLLATSDNKNVLTLANSQFSIGIYDRSENGRLNFRRNLGFDELGPAVGAPTSFLISPDDRYLYITSTYMYSIRCLKRDAVTKDLNWVASYTEGGTPVASGSGIVEGAIGLKNYYTATWADILAYDWNKDNGNLTYKSIYTIKENSENGLRAIKSIMLSPDNKYLYAASESEFYPDGITVLKRNDTNGSLSFLQKITGIKASKILVSNDNRFVYALGENVWVYSVNASTGLLALAEQLNIYDLGYTPVYRLEDGFISYDNRAVIGVTNQGKAILSFYRNTETGKVEFEEIRYYDEDSYNCSGETPKTIMSNDAKNVYVVSPYDQLLSIYKANVPLGLKKITDACGTDSALISVDEGYEYLWSNGITSHEFKTTVPGTYSVYVKDALGREGWDKTQLAFHENPVVRIELQEITEYSDTTWNLILYTDRGEWPFTYLWDNGYEEAFRPVDRAELRSKKEFHIIMTDAYGCMAMDTLFTNVLTGIGQISDKAGFYVTPNPVSNKMAIHFLCSPTANKTVELMDIKGNILFRSTPERDSAVYEMDMTSYAPGIYFIKLVSESRISVERIVKNE